MPFILRKNDPNFSIETLRWPFRELDRYPPGVLGVYEESDIQRLEDLLAAVSAGDLNIESL